MKRLALLFALILPMAATAETWQPPSGRHQAESARPVPARITMGDAMNLVQRTFGGRVVQAQPAIVNGHEGYRIKVLTAHGEVRVVHVDGETGAIQ